jgi:ABC-type branched-subunit amino acid transport system substrate-binding protein
MGNRRWILVWTLSLSACGGGDSDSCGPYDVRIGTVHSLSGPAGTDGVHINLAIDMAASEINAKKGVLGQKLCLIHGNTFGDEVKAQKDAERLINEHGVTAILGGDYSGASVGILKATSSKVPQISNAATSPALAIKGDNFFRTVASDSAQGIVLARLAKEKAYKNVSIIYVNDPYGVGLEASFKQNFEDADHKVVFSMLYDEGKATYQTLVTAALEPKPDAIALFSFVEGSVILVKEVKAIRAAPTNWLIGDGPYSDGFLTGLGNDVDYLKGCVGTAPGTSEEEADKARYDAFLKSYMTFARRDGNIYDATAYDATYLAAAAIQSARKDDGVEAIQHVLSVSKEGMAFGPGEWDKGLATLEAMKDVDYQGASGTVDLDQNGDAPAIYQVWTVEAGKYKTLAVARP